MEVLQLDDESVKKLYNDPESGKPLLISSADRRHIYLNGTKASLEKFAKACEDSATTVSVGAPRWYANSCTTSAKAIREMLKKIDAVMRL